MYDRDLVIEIFRQIHHACLVVMERFRPIRSVEILGFFVPAIAGLKIPASAVRFCPAAGGSSLFQWCGIAPVKRQSWRYWERWHSIQVWTFPASSTRPSGAYMPQNQSPSCGL